MPDWYYIDTAGQRRGPVEDEELLQLNGAARLRADTLVWREGMGADWVAFVDVAAPLFARKNGGREEAAGGGAFSGGNGEKEGEEERVEIGVCAHTRTVHPQAEMLAYGDAQVAADYREGFFQHLMETAAPGPTGSSGARLVYTGFWWRALAAFLDYLVKMVPGWIGMVPYYLVAMGMAFSPGGGEDAGLGWVIAMGAAYAFGMLFVLGFSIFYDTWMVGKYQATLGKMVIGSKVVNPDGSRLSYKRAFLRWVMKKVVDPLIVWTPPTAVFGIFFGLGYFFEEQGNTGAAIIASLMIAGSVCAVLATALGLGVYWMAAFDPEKRALHDRMAATRVVKGKGEKLPKKEKRKAGDGERTEEGEAEKGKKKNDVDWLS